MISNNKRPIFKKKVLIEGNCLFLIGPIGTFFARLSRYLEDNQVRTYKILFPLHEYGFSKSKIIKYDQDIGKFKQFLSKTIINYEIKHIFMYGNVLIPHKQALELVKELNVKGINVKTHIFELGYFNTGDVKAKYTLSGNTANERYEASGFDTSILYSKSEPLLALF